MTPLICLLNWAEYDMLAEGMDESRWALRSSKPLAGRVAGRGGFDSHPFPWDDILAE
jgi:hypothetical protein